MSFFSTFFFYIEALRLHDKTKSTSIFKPFDVSSRMELFPAFIEQLSKSPTVIIEPTTAADAWNEATRNLETHQRVESDYQLYLAKQNDLNDASKTELFSIAVFVLLIAIMKKI
jgi:hypothetical protein